MTIMSLKSVFRFFLLTLALAPGITALRAQTNKPPLPVPSVQTPTAPQAMAM